MQVAAAGTGVRLSRRLHQRAARRHRRAGARRAGGCTTAWYAVPWPARTTRAGTCTPGTCRPGTRPSTPSTARVSRAAAARLAAYLVGAGGGTVLDEPATARALAGHLLRGTDCGALDEAEVAAATGAGRAALERLAGRAG